MQKNREGGKMEMNGTQPSPTSMPPPFDLSTSNFHTSFFDERKMVNAQCEQSEENDDCEVD